MWEAITILLFSTANVSLAAIDANAIKKGKRILHGINGLVYIALLIAPYYAFGNWYMIAALLFNRLLVFNICLNLFRQLQWNYRPLKPASIVDKIGNLIPNANLMYGIYAALFVIFTTLSML